jgi:hypothetical protein
MKSSSGRGPPQAWQALCARPLPRHHVKCLLPISGRTGRARLMSDGMRGHRWLVPWMASAGHTCHNARRPVWHIMHHPKGTGTQPLFERRIPTLSDASTPGQPSTMTDYSGKHPWSHWRQLLGANHSGMPMQSSPTLQQFGAVHHACWWTPDVGGGTPRYCSTVAYLCIPLYPSPLQL